MKLLKSYIQYINENSTKVDLPSENKLLSMLKKDFPDYVKPNTTFPIEVKNNNGEIVKNINVQINADGKLIIDNAIMESNKLTKGLAALCLIGGMLTSCTKDNFKTYGYNIGTSISTYSIDDKNPNKEITVFYQGGIKKAKVDTFSKVGGNSIGAHAMIFKRPITKTEACILKAGAVYDKETAMNKTNNNSKVMVAAASIGKQPYTNVETSYADCRTFPDFQKGLIALQTKGMDVNAMLKDADKEVAKEEWYTFDDDDLKNRLANELKNNPVNIDISNYASLLKGYDIKNGAHFGMKDFDTRNTALRNFSKFNLRIPKPNILEFDNGAKKEMSYNYESKKWSDGNVDYTIKWDGEILTIENDGFITKYNLYGIAR